MPNGKEVKATFTSSSLLSEIRNKHKKWRDTEGRAGDDASS